jgi:hypothetical protein
MLRKKETRSWLGRGGDDVLVAVAFDLLWTSLQSERQYCEVSINENGGRKVRNQYEISMTKLEALEHAFHSYFPCTIVSRCTSSFHRAMSPRTRLTSIDVWDMTGGHQSMLECLTVRSTLGCQATQKCRRQARPALTSLTYY